MNPGIIRKTIRDTLPLLLIVTAAIILFELLVVSMVGEFSQDFATIWMQKPFFQRFIRMLIGAELLGDPTATAWMTIGFAHPMLYTLTWAFLLTTCSRVIVVEIERGTADLLLSLPVSRTSVYASVSVVWVLAGVVVSLTPLAGAKIGASVSPLWEPLDLSRLAILTANLFALYLAIGSCTLFVSSLVSRRGPAVAVMLAGLLGSFLLGFLAQLWPAAQQVSFLGILHYYRPLPIVQTGDWPVRDIAVLATLAACFWCAGLWRFTRRDIPAV